MAHDNYDSFAPMLRPDGFAKVTGAARYTTDMTAPGLVHAVILDSPVGRAQVRSIRTDIATGMPGVLGILTHENIAKVRGSAPPAWPQEPETFAARADQGAALALADNIVRGVGQPVAVIVAHSLVEALAAAWAIAIDYDVGTVKTRLSEGREQGQSARSGVLPGGYPADSIRGDVNQPFGPASTIIRATYHSAAAHPSPIEPGAALAEWRHGRLLIHDSNQGPHAIRKPLAVALGIPEEKVRVVSGFIGGAFGSKLQLWPHTYLAALAAKLVERPVKLVLTRAQMFTGTGHRPELIQDVVLAADQNGKLIAIRHDAVIESGVLDEFIEASVLMSRKRYLCPNVSTTTRLVHLDMPPGGPMRAPGKNTGAFALECALDELADALEIDPIELRLRNFADHDQETGQTWSTNRLRECYRIGADQFGWKKDAAERGWVDDNRRVGQGMAAASYPLYQFPASAAVSIRSDGKVVIETGVAEIGVGNTAVLPRIAAETLGIPVDRVSLAFGDTIHPYAPQAGGSRTVASVGRAVQGACEKLRTEANQICSGSHFDLDLVATALRASSRDRLTAMYDWKPDEDTQFASESYASHFCEVEIDALGQVRVRRFVTVVDAGRVLNPVTARSQVTGAVVMGIGQALHEELQVDHRTGAFVNANLGEYLIPTHADVPTIEVYFCGEHDPYAGPLGAKSLGEIGIVGVAASVANAVYAATGSRIRSIPIRIVN